MDEVAALRQQVAEALNERDLLSKGIADSACKLGITSEGVALTGPHLLMLLGDMVGMVEGLQARSAELERVMRDIRGANAAYALSKIDAALAQSAPSADEQGVAP